MLLILTVCLAVVAVLRLVAAGGESAGTGIVRTVPTPAVTTDQGCANFARYWMVESGVGVSADVIEALGNCRRAADGTWFVPTGLQDPRLPPEARLTTAEREQTAAERAELLAQIAALEAAMPQTLQRWLREMYDPTARAMTGHIRDGFRIGVRRGRYTRLAQAFLMDPRYEALARYAGWIMARRIAAYDAFLAACLSREELAHLANACRGVEDQLSIRFPPFPWDLKDPVTLDAYFIAQLRGEAKSQANPLETPAPATTPAPAAQSAVPPV
jgi:hypothetical protein